MRSRPLAFVPLPLSPPTGRTPPAARTRYGEGVNRGDLPHDGDGPWRPGDDDFRTDPALEAAVENLLLRELGEARPPRPLDQARIIEWMRDCDYTYFTFPDGQVGGIFLGRLFSFGILGPNDSVLCIRGTWNRELAIERVGEILDFCNQWNATRLWPKTYSRVLDNGLVQVHTEVVADLEPGATDEQLDQILECGLRTGVLFFDALDARYPDPVRLAP